MRASCFMLAALSLSSAGQAGATTFRFVTGVDMRRYPGTSRPVAPDGVGCCDGAFSDGDRLAGTSDVGDVVPFVGFGTPLYPANHLGSLSFLFRRGSIPAPPFRVPLMGIDFLGGPLLDLDGDNNNGVRSLVPIVGRTPVEIPSGSSHVDLSFDLAGGTVTIDAFDATGTNEGGVGIQAEITTVLVTLAGTTATGDPGPRPNPVFDTRGGVVTPHAGPGGPAPGVHRIDDLRVELWYDSIDPNSSTASVLGTFQHFNEFDGWLVVRDCETGQFPTLTGAGLGSTRWPEVVTTRVGHTFNTAHGLSGGTATITDGVAGDTFSVPGNGGLGLTDYGGDLGAWFDVVVIPALDPQATAFLYVETAGFGINNSSDPVYTDTVGYDAVVVAQTLEAPPTLAGDVNGDGLLTLDDGAALVVVLLDPAAATPCRLSRADVNADGAANGVDIQSLVDLLLR